MQIARRRLRVARYSIGVAAVAAFAAFGLAVRESHPAASSGTARSVVSSTEASDDAFSDDSAVISPAPQAAVPQIQSAGS